MLCAVGAMGVHKLRKNMAVKARMAPLKPVGSGLGLCARDEAHQRPPCSAQDKEPMIRSISDFYYSPFLHWV